MRILCCARVYFRWSDLNVKIIIWCKNDLGAIPEKIQPWVVEDMQFPGVLKKEHVEEHKEIPGLN